jgi:hypothetical protein
MSSRMIARSDLDGTAGPARRSNGDADGEPGDLTLRRRRRKQVAAMRITAWLWAQGLGAQGLGA